MINYSTVKRKNLLKPEEAAKTISTIVAGKTSATTTTWNVMAASIRVVLNPSWEPIVRITMPTPSEFAMREGSMPVAMLPTPELPLRKPL